MHQKLYDYLVTTYGNDFNCSLTNMMTDGYEFSMSFGKLTVVFPRNSTYDDWNNLTYSSFVKKRINSFFLQQVNQIIANLYDEELIKAKFILSSEIKAEVAINKPEEIRPARKNINANY